MPPKSFLSNAGHAKKPIRAKAQRKMGADRGLKPCRAYPCATNRTPENRCLRLLTEDQRPRGPHSPNNTQPDNNSATSSSSATQPISASKNQRNHPVATVRVSPLAGRDPKDTTKKSGKQPPRRTETEDSAVISKSECRKSQRCSMCPGWVQ